MSWAGKDEEEQAVDRTVFAGHELLLSRLERVVNMVNLGASTSWPLAKRASYCLRAVGGGGSVSVDKPQTIRRAITILQNYTAETGS